MSEMDNAVKALMTLAIGDFDDCMFVDMLAGGFGRANAKSHIRLRQTTGVPNWMRALANATDQEYGREIAIRTFLAERSIHDVINDDDVPKQ
jgi:hypothetical protein